MKQINFDYVLVGLFLLLIVAVHYIVFTGQSESNRKMDFCAKHNSLLVRTYDSRDVCIPKSLVLEVPHE